MKINTFLHKKKKFKTKAQIHDNLAGQHRGLMFRRPLKKGTSILIEFPSTEVAKKYMIHCFFVFFRIDILWLNEEHKIVQIKRKVLPFTPALRVRKPYKSILELPAGAAASLKVGDKLERLNK